MSTVLHSRKKPVECVLTRQAGDKLLMNLVYYLDHKKVYSKPRDIESQEKLLWRDLGQTKTNKKKTRIAIFRSPTPRFVEFYFEKFTKNSPYHWASWSEDLQKAGADFSEGVNLDQHQKNAHILLDKIEDQAAKIGLFNLPQYIAPQVCAVLPTQDYGFDVIEYSSANVELANVLRPEVKNIDKLIARIEDKLRTVQDVNYYKFANPPLVKRLQEIYAIDFDFYEVVRHGKTQKGQTDFGVAHH